MSGDAPVPGKARPAALRQEDIEQLRAGEMPGEFITRVLESNPAEIEPGKRKKSEKLRPVDLDEAEMEATVAGNEIPEGLAERLEEAGKLDANRKRAAGKKAARPEKTPPGQKRQKKGS
jgi:hypothetical protein